MTMRIGSKPGPAFLYERISFRVRRWPTLATKGLVRAVVPRCEHPTTLLLVGCQRAGTSIMENVLEKDLHSAVYLETCKFTKGDPTCPIRIKPLDVVADMLARERARLIVLKPLAESQHTTAMLDAFPRCRAIWMYRSYRDTARSNLRFFGIRNGINNLRPIAKGEPNNWRSDGVSDEVRETIAHHFSETMNPYDAAALFWWARNRIFFERSLAERDDLRTLEYADFVGDPGATIRSIYSFCGLPYPGDRLVQMVHRQSVGLGRELDISDDVEKLCMATWRQLVHANESRSVLAVQ